MHSHHSTRTAACTTTVVLAVALTACSGATPAAVSSPTQQSAAPADIAALIDIGDGRSLYMECRGTGSPTVLLISGTRGAADEWDTLLPDAAADTVSTFDAVSDTTRVCAYDRPGTTLDSGEPTASTVVPQPTTALQGAEDLHALMEATGQPGPYVVVGLSWGGMIAQQFARTYADEVEGIVLLDSASEFLKTAFTPEQWSAWMSVVDASGDAAGSEVPAYEPSIAELQATPALPAMPAIVMSSDHPWDLQVTPGDSTWPGWVVAQAELALSLNATHITDTDSGHGLPVEQPALVTQAVLDVVDAVRAAQ
ncbi:Pimeloyl-ACP methyl ester carboxylesterase [Microbacterium sp. cf046]|uniref:alpha/beta fold hydrolase n=1 Tax=Microbacterium sp. cf046 TaxID=1761803 RepID=UPI0008E04D36|nr:alpha/beta hydrolase [Microbacterium sp. cf046]SFS03566.1 Pimeloyl-ACP methyl ester carboxylesterase [Microbacterium sp. cf046]